MGNPNFSGVFGNTASDVAGVGRTLIKDSQADQEKKRAQALQDSLAKLQFDKFGYEQKHDTDVAGATAAENATDNTRLQQQLDATIEGNKATRDATEVNRLRLDADRDESRKGIQDFRTAMVGLRTRGLDQADTRIAQAGTRATLTAPDENGDRWFVSPITHQGSRAMIQPDGSLAPEDPHIFGEHLQAGGHPMPGAGAKPTPASQGAGVAPDGAPEHPIQPGSTQVPADTHGATTAVPPSHPMKGPTPQNERNTAATFAQLKGLFGEIKAGMESVKYQPPGAATQFGLEMTKGQGAIPLVPNSIEKIVGNNAVGMFAPKYQNLETSYNALSTFLTQMITGAQMSQQEADRIRNLVAMRSGDTAQTIATRMREAQGIIDAAEAKVSPRASGGGGAPAPTGAPKGQGGTPEAKAYYDSLKAQGMSPDQALAETDKVYPR